MDHVHRRRRLRSGRERRGFIDDIEVRVDTLVTSIEEGASWGRIKSMYRD
jgi:hypothetical protein